MLQYILTQLKEIIMKVTLKEIAELLDMKNNTTKSGLNSFAIGQEVIIRTYSAGVWFGRLKEKSGEEVILTEARRMWHWRANESISLSGVAIHGINQENSRIAGAVESVWLEAVEIIPVSGKPAESIRMAEETEQDKYLDKPEPYGYGNGSGCGSGDGSSDGYGDGDGSGYGSMAQETEQDE